MLLGGSISAQKSKSLSLYVSPDLGYYGSNNTVSGVTIGPRMEFELVKGISFQSGLLYSYRYSRDRYEIDTNSFFFSTQFIQNPDGEFRNYLVTFSHENWQHSLSVPVLLKARLGNQDRKLKLYGLIGFRAGIILVNHSLRQSYNLSSEGINVNDVIRARTFYRTNGLPNWVGSFGAIGARFQFTEKLAFNLEPQVNLTLLSIKAPYNHNPPLGLGMEIAYKL